MATLTFRLNDRIFLRDPQNTELGQRIIRKSIEMIDQLGFEHFTFKKLAEEIDSTEASIYRYFENKHRLLLYLISWYWSWLEYRIDLFTSTARGPREKLRACLRVLCEEKRFDPSFEFIDEEALHRIVLSELDKTYLTKTVDEDNQDGLFSGLKSLCKKIAAWVVEVNPAYPFPHSLVSTLLLTSKQQLFFAAHLPTLTDLKGEVAERHEQLHGYLEKIMFHTIDQV